MYVVYSLPQYVERITAAKCQSQIKEGYFTVFKDEAINCNCSYTQQCTGKGRVHSKQCQHNTLGKVERKGISTT